MGAVLLDTTVLIDVLRGRPAADRLRALRGTGDRVHVCAINVEEVARGLRPGEEEADCLIASAAVSIGARLATGDPRDFPMPELAVEHWPVGL